jgi:2-amino-4-hydroxy-6-hydroxymethyldihydropteridine diphosphokinase
MAAAFVGIGSNLNEPVTQVQAAFAELDRLPLTSVTGRSSLYRSAPVGHAAQPDFINAVARLETGLAANALLAELQAVEARHGRQRSFANAPRTLDLDLLLYGNDSVDTMPLKIPHPRMHQRLFVLRPLLDIEDVEIPGKGRASALLGLVKDQAVEKLA